MKKISIVITILNEGDNIKILINKILKNLRKLKKNFIIEIIFIDDNSTDNTREIFKNLKKKKYTLLY